MRFERPRLEFRVELAGHEPWMPGYFHDLHKITTWTDAGKPKPV
jgi:hypothetical protein